MDEIEKVGIQSKILGRMINMELYSAKDIQRILKLGRDKTYKLLNSKGFPSIKIGRDIRVPKDEFDKWIKRNTGKEVYY